MWKLVIFDIKMYNPLWPVRFGNLTDQVEDLSALADNFATQSTVGYVKFTNLASSREGFDLLTFNALLRHRHFALFKALDLTSLAIDDRFLDEMYSKYEKGRTIDLDIFNEDVGAEIANLTISNVEYVTMNFSAPNIDRSYFDSIELHPTMMYVCAKFDNILSKVRPDLSSDIATNIIEQIERDTIDIDYGFIYSRFSIGRTTIFVEVSKLYVRMKTDRYMDPQTAKDFLESNFNLQIDDIYDTDINLSVTLDDIPFEPFTFNWELAKDKTIRNELALVEGKEAWWRKESSLKYIGDKYAGKNTELIPNPIIHLGNKYRVGWTRQPLNGEKFLTLNIKSWSRRWALHVASLFIEIAKRVTFQTFQELLALLTDEQKVLFGLILQTYIEGATKEYINKDKATRIWTAEQNLEPFMATLPSSVHRVYSLGCKYRNRPIIVPGEDVEDWRAAGYDTKSVDMSGTQWHFRCKTLTDSIRTLEIRIGDVVIVTACCNVIQDRELEAEDLDVPSSIIAKSLQRGLEHHTIKSTLIPIDSDYSLVILGIVDPSRRMLIDIISHVLGREFDSNSIVNERFAIPNNIFIDHEKHWDMLEEIYRINLIVIEKDDLAGTNRDYVFSRPSILVECIRNNLGEPFYNLVVYQEARISAHVLYENGSHDIITHLNRIYNHVYPQPTNRSKLLRFPRGVESNKLVIRGKQFNVVGQILDSEGWRRITIIDVDNIELAIISGQSIPINVPIRTDIPPQYPDFAALKEKLNITEGFIQISSQGFYMPIIDLLKRIKSVINAGAPEGAGYPQLFLYCIIPRGINNFPRPALLETVYEAKGIDEIELYSSREKTTRVYLNALAYLWKMRGHLGLERFVKDYLHKDVLNKRLEVVGVVQLTPGISRQNLMIHLQNVSNFVYRDRNGVYRIIYRADDEDEIVYFLRVLDRQPEVNVSVNGDRLRYELDYTQSDQVITFATAETLRAWMAQKIGSAEVSIISNIHSAIRLPYKLIAGDKTFLILNSRTFGEAFMKHEYYMEHKYSPPLDYVFEDMPALEKLRRIEYVKWGIDKSGVVKMDTTISNINSELNILNYENLRSPYNNFGAMIPLDT